jgi:ornithine decarboxylase
MNAAQLNPFHMSDAQIRELAAGHGTPLYIVNSEKIRQNYRLLDEALPAVTLFYAMKANPHPGILDILAAEGAGFDVASKGEFLAAVAAGANPREDLIFADTVKDPRHIAHAHSIGLDDFTYDNPSELTQIARHAPGANVHLRLMVSNQGSVAHLSKKFGAEPRDAVDLLLKARQHGLNPRGVSFHVGSQCLDARRYVEAFQAVREVFDGAARHGMDLEMIDIGGGFPVRYLDEEIDLRAMCAVIDGAYRELFGNGIKLVAEPGRALVGDAVILVTKVISESVRQGQNWLYFDDGTYGSFMEVLLYHTEYPLRALSDGPLTPYVLAGPTCDSIDVFSRDQAGKVRPVDLPEMHLDDLLVAGSMGAYTFSEATRFNGFEPPGFLYI